MTLHRYAINPEHSFIPEDRLIEMPGVEAGVYTFLTQTFGESGIAVTNRLFMSINKKERLVKGKPVPAQMLASEKGMELVRNNPGLLGAIEIGALPTVRTFKGTEGVLNLVYLHESDGSQTPYLIKYTHAIIRNDQKNDDYIYTPQVDAMRFMQLAQAEQPIEGINYVAPLLATIDMSITPFVPNTINLQELLWMRSRQGLRVIEGYDDETYQLGREVFYHSNYKVIEEFIRNNQIGLLSFRRGNQGSVVDWFFKAQEINQEVLLADRFLKNEVNALGNVVVRLDLFLDLLDNIDNYLPLNAKRRVFDERFEIASEFLVELRKCMYVIELAAGYENILNTSYNFKR